jgi:exodeoxyribonuclease-5
MIGIESVAFAAYTGKAALRMRQKGCIGATTIHRLAYDVIDEEYDEKTKRYSPVFSAKGAVPPKLIVLDECSMVDEQIALDLLAFGIPILMLGDPGQLPPVKGDSKTGYFIDSDKFHIDAPDFMLTEIHRQASGSPIIKLATYVRLGNPFKSGRSGDVRVESFRSFSDVDVAAFDGSGTYPNDKTQVIAGTHRTRIAYNNKVRKMLQRSDQPEAGDRVICCRNSPKLGVMNGELCTVVDVSKSFDSSFWEMSIRKDGEDRERPCLVWNHPFHGEDMRKMSYRDRCEAEEFDYAYAITCHKAQGSEFDNVVVFDEGLIFRENRYRWAYTAATRAAKRLLVAI